MHPVTRFWLLLLTRHLFKLIFGASVISWYNSRLALILRRSLYSEHQLQNPFHKSSNPVLGIPCFAFMMSAMSDFINNQLLHLRQFVEHYHRIKLPRWFIPSIYIGGGCALLIGAPVIIFMKMEKWSTLQSLYFGTFPIWLIKKTNEF